MVENVVRSSFETGSPNPADSHAPNQELIFTDHDRGVARTAGEQYLYDSLSIALANGYLPGWRVYEQPHLNGDRPDFVLTHPDKGVVIIEVKDWNLTALDTVACSGSPALQLSQYRKNITQLYSRKFLPLEKEFGKGAWAIIETATYFHCAERDRARGFLQQRGFDHPYVGVLDREHIAAIREGRLESSGISTLKYEKSKYARFGLLADFVDDLEGWLRPVDYSIGRERPLRLTSDQARHASPAPGVHRRLKGPAGAGKTVVLASRAAKLLASGQRVLFLTYNITLMHFIRDLIAQQYQGEDGGPIQRNLVVRYFHSFVQTAALKHGIKLGKLPDGEKPVHRAHREELLERVWIQELLDGVRNLNGSIDPDWQFDAVLIDEGQDFTRLWLLSVLEFLRERNELMIAFDAVQNIYGRELVWLDSGGDVKDLGFLGPPAELKDNHRLPARMVRLATRFAEEFLDLPAPPSGDQSQDSLFDKEQVLVQWENVGTILERKITEKVIATTDVVLDKLGAHPNDLAILVESHKVALPIIRALRDAGYRVSHVFDDRDGGIGAASHAYRRSQKWKFQPTNGQVKVCTVHSFKGWEAPYVLCVVDQPHHFQGTEDLKRRAALIYIGMTRLKRKSGSGLAFFGCINADPRFNSVEQLVSETA